MVALAGINDDEIAAMLRWCAGEGHDLTLIETMPLGEVEDDRTAHYLPLDRVRRELEQSFDLTPSLRRTGGPARYYEVGGLRVRLGLITPLTDNFCDGCNRIRVAATGTVYGCLGHDQKVELRDALREGGAGAVDALLDRLLAGKPRRHDFRIAPASAPAVARHMSVTGG
jgi:cyclic pyranopterin phosphate synthase